MTVQQQLFIEKPRAGKTTRAADAALRGMNYDHLSLLVEQGQGDQLRRLVLELAVRGRLLRPDATLPKPRLGSGTSPSNTGRRARSRDDDSPPPTEREQPFTIPENWLWGRVNDTGEYINGLAFKPSDWGSEGYPIIRIQNLTDSAKPINRCKRTFDDAYIVRTGDLLVSWSATLDVFIWDREPGVLNQHIFRVLPNQRVLLPRFLFHALRHCIRDMAESDHAHGLVMKHINRGPFLAHPVPIPPIAEQHRIVAKVDEMMRLIDNLEARQTKKRDVQTRFRTSALDALTRAEGAEELAAAWTRVAGNFEVVAERTDAVPGLRKAIISAAMTGRLTKQDAREQRASDLLKTTAMDATWRIPEREGRAKLDPNIEALAGRVPLPAGWAEPRLNDVVQLINGRAYAQPELLAEGTPVIRIQNLNGGNRWYYSDLTLPERQYCDNDDLLFAWSASFGPYLWRGARAIYHYHIWKLNLSRAVDKMFFYYALVHLTDVVKEKSHGLAMLHMTKGQMERWPIPLPPLAEQKRIVAKVEALMKLCDDLEARLRTNEATATRLIEAVVAELVA